MKRGVAGDDPIHKPSPQPQREREFKKLAIGKRKLEMTLWKHFFATFAIAFAC